MLVLTQLFPIHTYLCHAGTGTVACAPLIDVETITLNQPTKGYLTVSQRGPYEETVITTTTLPSTAVSYHTASCMHLVHSMG